MTDNQKFIPLSVPNIKGNEKEYVNHTIDTEWVSSAGGYITKFEENIASYVNSTGAVACQSGTAGLHIALKVCGVKSNHEVIVPTLTFIASVNPIKYIGAEPVFIDCDDSLCMDMTKLNDFCTNQCDFIDSKLINKATKKHIKAVLVVHIFGNMADMAALKKTADKYNLKIIEDAAEALGTYYTEGEYCGKHAGTIGDIGVYSFNGNKIITTGGGGMIVSNDKSILDRARHLTTQAKTDTVYFLHDEIGYNYRMTNVQAALGLGQLEQLEKFIETKTYNYNKYKTMLSDVKGIRMQGFAKGTRPNYWFYSLLINDECASDRDELLVHLNENNIQTRPVWGLIHQQKPYEDCQKYEITKASIYYKQILNIPCSSNLTEDDVETVVYNIKKYVDCQS